MGESGGANPPTRPAPPPDAAPADAAPADAAPADAAPADAALGDSALADALALFETHLRAERGFSAHTVRAYTGDVRRLLDHAARSGISTPTQLNLGLLRSWLARERTTRHA